jgi:hypothetical protein
MHRTRLIRCSCCGLDRNARVDDDATAVALCSRCTGHRRTTAETVAVLEADHAAMYKHAMIDAQDDLVLAHGERDFYRDKMHTAYRTRQLLVQVLAEIDEVHHQRGKRCACGRSGCRILGLLSDPRVGRLVRAYDEERRTLRELRNANPELWTEAWDYIDDALVYPPRPNQANPGRHRASG